MVNIFKYDQPFTLECGVVLPEFHLAYTTHGELNADGTNAVWIFHALTANSDPAEWWPGLVGEGKMFDPQQYYIVCVNMPGSCYGSMGPLDLNPQTGHSWYHDFPFFTTRDMVRTYQHLKKFLGIKTIHVGIGGSMGGQQLLEWSIEQPELFEHIFRSQLMLSILRGASPSMHLNGWRSKRIVAGTRKDLMQARKE